MDLPASKPTITALITPSAVWHGAPSTDSTSISPPGTVTPEAGQPMNGPLAGGALEPQPAATPAVNPTSTARARPRSCRTKTTRPTASRRGRSQRPERPVGSVLSPTITTNLGRWSGPRSTARAYRPAYSASRPPAAVRANYNRTLGPLEPCDGDGGLWYGRRAKWAGRTGGSCSGIAHCAQDCLDRAPDVIARR
jgi:hypothetical protein